MQELETMISIYHAAFITFLILAILFLVISIILFFRFDIRGIFDMKTGRGARKAIQKMQELNDQTGKLRQESVTAGRSEMPPQDRISAPPTEKRQEDSQKTDILVNEESQETALLSECNETTILSSNEVQEVPQPEKIKLPGAFKIEKEIMWVHTEERL